MKGAHPLQIPLFESHPALKVSYPVARSHRTAPGTSERGVAERVGFEPTVELPRQQFSRLPDSAALAPLRSYVVPEAPTGWDQ